MSNEIRLGPFKWRLRGGMPDYHQICYTRVWAFPGGRTCTEYELRTEDCDGDICYWSVHRVDDRNNKVLIEEGSFQDEDRAREHVERRATAIVAEECRIEVMA